MSAEDGMAGFAIGFVFTLIIACFSLYAGSFYSLDKEYLHTFTCDSLGGEYLGEGWITCDSGFTLDGDKKPLCRVQDDILFFTYEYDYRENIIEWKSRKAVCGGGD